MKIRNINKTAVYSITGLLLTSCPLLASASWIETEFGAPTDLSVCTRHGDSADRSCSTGFRHVSDSDVQTSTLNILGQASADRSSCYLFWCPPDASAELELEYQIPLFVRRSVEFIPQPDGSYTIVVPQPTIRLSVTINGFLASYGWGGIESDDQPTFNGVRVYGDEFFGPWEEEGASLTQYTNDYDPEHDILSFGVPFLLYDIYRYQGHSEASRTLFSGDDVGEIDDGAQIPFNTFRVWRDEFAPYAAYGSSIYGGFMQQQVGYLRLITTLYAQSRNGDESIACFGMESTMDGMIGDAGCGDGYIQLTASIINDHPPYTFTVMPAGTTVPEPGSLTLLSLGLAGLGLSRRRKAN